MEAGHQSVLLSEAIDALQIQPTDRVIDATVGGAGHFSAMLSALGSGGTLIGIDADKDAIERAKQVIDSGTTAQIFLKERNFRNLSEVLDELEIQSVTKVLFDLGWSGYQLSAGRGFSFQNDEPLLMTYGEPDGSFITAMDVLNTFTESEIADILYEYGEEHLSRRIAKAIVDHRKESKILTTKQLVDIIQKATPIWYHNKKLHPATKTFQALRIYVNDELNALKEGLSSAMERTAPNGRIAVISFHSIEDRIVKNMFRDAVTDGKGALVTKKPIPPSPAELHDNPRSRSAKLRVFELSA